MKKKKAYSLIYGLFFLALLIGNTGCEPLEAITDAYADIVDDIGPDDDNNEETVGTVSMTLISSFTNVDDFTITVLNLNGDRLTRPVAVTCIFTDKNTQEIVSTTTASTVDSQATCSFINGSTSFISYIAVATAEGVTSDSSNLFVEPVGST